MLQASALGCAEEGASGMGAESHLASRSFAALWMIGVLYSQKQGILTTHPKNSEVSWSGSSMPLWLGGVLPRMRSSGALFGLPALWATFLCRRLLRRAAQGEGRSVDVCVKWVVGLKKNALWGGGDGGASWGWLSDLPKLRRCLWVSFFLSLLSYVPFSYSVSLLEKRKVKAANVCEKAYSCLTSFGINYIWLCFPSARKLVLSDKKLMPTSLQSLAQSEFRKNRKRSTNWDLVGKNLLECLLFHFLIASLTQSRAQPNTLWTFDLPFIAVLRCGSNCWLSLVSLGFALPLSGAQNCHNSLQVWSALQGTALEMPPSALLVLFAASWGVWILPWHKDVSTQWSTSCGLAETSGRCLGFLPLHWRTQ